MDLPQSVLALTKPGSERTAWTGRSCALEAARGI